VKIKADKPELALPHGPGEIKKKTPTAKSGIRRKAQEEGPNPAPSGEGGRKGPRLSKCRGVVSLDRKD